MAIRLTNTPTANSLGLPAPPHQASNPNFAFALRPLTAGTASDLRRRGLRANRQKTLCCVLATGRHRRIGRCRQLAPDVAVSDVPGRVHDQHLRSAELPQPRFEDRPAVARAYDIVPPSLDDFGNHHGDVPIGMGSGDAANVFEKGSEERSVAATEPPPSRMA